MARSLPDALRLRELKYGAKSSDSDRKNAATALEQAGRHAEALDLYLLAEDAEGEQRLHRRAVAEGRPSVLLTLLRQGRAVPEAEWSQAGAAAFAARRWREAYRCFAMAGDEAGLERVREQLPEYEIYIPQGK